MSGFIAVLMLDTAFPRIEGDVGNPASYPMPVRLYTVEGADVMQVVRPGPPDAAIVARFVEAAQRAERDGAVGILTSCGFMGHAQARLAQAVAVPVVASALCLGPLIRTMTGGRPIGIITADSRALTPDLLHAAGLDAAECAIIGLQDAPAWRRLILAPKDRQATVLDPGEIGALVASRALALRDAHPQLGAILMECTNLPPYASRVRACTGLPLYHILHAADLIWSGHTQRSRIVY